jgi:hypothetical protein
VCACRPTSVSPTVYITALARVLLAVAMFYAGGLSLISPHQEFRFLLPCLPALHLVMGSVWSRMWTEGADGLCDEHVPAAPSEPTSEPAAAPLACAANGPPTDTAGEALSTEGRTPAPRRAVLTWWRILMRCIIVLTIVVHVLAALFLCRFHQVCPSNRVHEHVGTAWTSPRVGVSPDVIYIRVCITVYACVYMGVVHEGRNGSQYEVSILADPRISG